MRVLCVVVAAGIATLAFAASANAERFSGFVTCGVSDATYKAPARHTCYVGDLPHAVFIDRKKDRTRYRKCVTVPNGRTYCARHRTKAAGRRSQRPLYVEQVGWYRVTWHVGGRQVERWRFRMAPENA